jgi:alpha-mannosidase
MILKRVEKENEVKCLIESSNILASTYNKGTKDLTLTFKNGTQYKYPNVKNTDYTRFETAESQGKVFNSHIKQYSFEKIGTIDTAAIHESIDTVKVDTRIAMENHIQLYMKNFLTRCEENGGRFPANAIQAFDELTIEVEKYKSI